MELYASPYHVLERNEDASMYTYVRSEVPWPDVATVRSEFDALEKAVEDVDTTQAVFFIDTRKAPSDNAAQFVHATAGSRKRFISRFRRTALLVETSQGAHDATNMIVRGLQDCSVFRDEKTARHFLGQ